MTRSRYLAALATGFGVGFVAALAVVAVELGVVPDTDRLDPHRPDTPRSIPT